MNPLVVSLSVAGLSGLVLGFLYFGGLWWTLRRIAGARHPYRLLAFSFVGRLTLLAGGFFLVMGDRWERLAASFLGFLVARGIVTYVVIPPVAEGKDS